MFPKKNRADRKVIKQIFEKGVFVGGDNLTLKFILDQKTPSPRISFVVPKTVTKSAVKRNALRRRGYGVLKNYLKRFPNNFNGVFLFGKKSISLFSGKNKTSIPLLEQEINKIINKLKFFN